MIGLRLFCFAVGGLIGFNCLALGHAFFEFFAASASSSGPDFWIRLWQLTLRVQAYLRAQTFRTQRVVAGLPAIVIRSYGKSLSLPV